MPDYKETTASATQWQRCVSVNIQNTYGQTPQIYLQEEQITNVAGQLFNKPVGGINIQFDPNAVIDLLDPATGLPVGSSMTQAQIHVALWSLYMQSAKARDLGT